MDVITGASGHLGNTLLRELAAAGRTVRPLFRSPPSFEMPDGVTPYYCDPEEADALVQAFLGAETVYHTAGFVSFALNSYKKLYAANVAVTRNVIGACLKSGVKRLIHVGTIEAFDLLAGEYPITEESAIRPEHTVMPYGKTKALAVLDVEQAVRDRGLDAVIVFPTGFIGPFDYKISAMTRLVLDFLDGRIPAGIAGGFDFVDVRDVAAGMMHAAKKGNPGDRYMLPGRYTTVRELLLLLEELTGKPAPRLDVPSGLSTAFGAAAELFYLLSGKPPRYTRKSIKILSLGVTVNGGRAQEKLGYSPRPLSRTLKDTLDWLVGAGYRGKAAT